MPNEWQTAAEVAAHQGGIGGAGDPSVLPVPTPIDEDEILLAKETNEEQLQIIRRLAASGSVLVQGPPGTGKTHTIGNIIGHLLAQGKTVLVTSHTPKALRVLRDQIPGDLRPLCVSAVGGDRESRQQLEAAITEINARLARSSVEGLHKEIEQRVKERRKILEENRRLTAELREALESEYREISSQGKAITPAEAARYVKRNSASSCWIPGPIEKGVSLPLSLEEFSTLYATNIEFNATEERDASYVLPAIDGLMTEARFRSLATDIENLLALNLGFKSELWTGAGNVTSGHLAELLDHLSREFSENYRKLSWRPYAIVAGIQGGIHRRVWETLASKIIEASELSAKYSLSLHHLPRLSPDIPVVRQCEILDEILVYLGDGGRLGLVQLLTRTEWRKLINASGVSAGRPDREEHFRALSLLANLQRLRAEIGALWDNLLSHKGGTRFDELGSEPEQSARPLVEEIRRCLDWHQRVWLPLVDRIRACGVDFDKAMSSMPREPSPTTDYDLAEKAGLEILPPIFEAQIRRIRLEECESEFARQVNALLDTREERGCVSSLIGALRAKDPRKYREALDYTRRLHEISPIVESRRVLLEKLRKAAPTWVSAIENRVEPHHVRELPGDPAAAWTWRQLHEELNRRHALDAQALQKEIEQNRKILREVTISLIDLRAWVNQIERVRSNHSVRQALVGWLDTIKRIKSTQKKDILWRLQSEARNLMKLSAKAVPVWIMPLAVAAENFDPTTTRFDVVIIDEASQADLNALVAIYQADKVIIVGDHEQVTPEAVGKDQSLVHNLIDTYIRDIPNSRLFDNRFSIYDVGRQSFGDAICLLEHFRCVPEIIAFSNRLSYDGRIRPLRESNSTEIKPACIAYRVNGVSQNQVNHKEAETIVDLIRAMCRHPKYVGKTIGVISMVGENQANLIASKLRKELDPIEYEQRRIICGNSAQFQGDERHIMFLSMIDSGKEHGLGPIAKKGEGAWESTKKRYNVAASRAQDQLWVVHSLDPDNDLKPGDLRQELILHAKNPMSTMLLFKQEEPRTESEFERQVLRILINNGFRVRSQWKVGYYRIDMVIEGQGKRLAVECDGDRWHPIEKLADDLARQAILERLGWNFIRIRGSAFFRDEEKAIQPLFDRLDELGIQPTWRDDDPVEDSSLIKELEAIVTEFHQDQNERPSERAYIEAAEKEPPALTILF
jgi:very-short-patch-repair endonuclease